MQKRWYIRMDIIEYANIYQELRDQIQSYDEKILALLETRTALAKSLVQLKEKHGNDIYMPIVENAKIEKLSKKCQFPGLVELVWPVIMCYARTK